jgi:DNA-binding NtrC family response regulator
LLVDDDATFRKALSKALGRRSHSVEAAGSPNDAVAAIERSSYDVALLDLKMPGMNGIELMQELQRHQPGLPVVILTGHGTIPSAIEAIQAGAYHYLQKPCEVDEVEITLRNAMQTLRLIKENTRLKEAIQAATAYQGIVGTSGPIREVIDIIERTKDSWSPVLIQGESGTGKELVARALHAESDRRDQPFVTLNCAGLKPELLENELFGHVTGAFTGASQSKSGLFDVADGGTLFIDEVADMNLTVQASLLRVVEGGAFRPLGSTKEKTVRVRLIAAANRCLHDEVAAGRFRQDLLYRLDVVHV